MQPSVAINPMAYASPELHVVSTGGEIRRRSCSGGSRGTYCMPRCAAAAFAIRGSSFAVRPFAQPLPSPAATAPNALTPVVVSRGPTGPPRWLPVAGRLPVVRPAVARRTPGSLVPRRRAGFVLLRFDLALLGVQALLRLELGADELISRVGDRADELIELQLRRLRIAVLGVLNEEHHEEGDDRRTRVDHELPRV